MFKRSAESLKSLLLRIGKKDKRIQVAIVITVVAPVILIGALDYLQTHQNLTESLLSRPQPIDDATRLLPVVNLTLSKEEPDYQRLQARCQQLHA